MVHNFSLFEGLCLISSNFNHFHREITQFSLNPKIGYGVKIVRNQTHSDKIKSSFLTISCPKINSDKTTHFFPQEQNCHSANSVWLLLELEKCKNFISLNHAMHASFWIFGGFGYNGCSLHHYYSGLIYFLHKSWQKAHHRSKRRGIFQSNISKLEWRLWCV